MKRAVLLLAVCLLVVVANAEDVLIIRDVGLNYYHSGSVMPLRLALNNPLPTDLPLTLQIESHSDQKMCVPSSFRKQIVLRPREHAEISIPIIDSRCGYWANRKDRLDVTAFDPTGRKIANVNTGSERFLDGAPTVVLCTDEKVCDEVQSQISLNGTEDERNKKSREVTFLVLRGPLSEWWSYDPARTVIIAAPLDRYTTEQKQAVEGYLRHGGTVIAVEDQLKDASFLSAYRGGEGKDEDSKKIAVIRGILYRVSSLRSGELAKLYQGKSLEAFTSGRVPVYNENFSAIDWLGSRVGPQFEFPKLRWLILWMSAYVVVLGVLNFAVLRKLRRLEWGWITITGCALLFSAWFYLSNYYRGPHKFEGTSVAIFWMDQQSPIALSEYAVTVASPKRTESKVFVAGKAILQPGDWTDKNDSTTDIYEGIAGERTFGEGWQVVLNDPQQVNLSMLRWSSRTLDFHDFRRFAGTVHWSAPNRLKNDTGEEFKQGVYVDSKACTMWFVNSFKPGQEIDVTTLASKPFMRNWACKGTKEDHERSRDQLLTMPMLEGAAWKTSLPEKGFIGSLDSGSLPAEIDQKGVEWHKAALVVVPLS